MKSIDHSTEERQFHTKVQQDFRWNFTANALDSALFWLGLSFAAPATIMPLYVRHLTDSQLLLGLIGTIGGAGWYLPQLLTANYIERLPRKKPVVVNIGFFSERLPILVMSASTFLFAATSPSLALRLFFLAWTWHTVGAGMIAVAWQEMFARVIPVHYRGRLLGIANFAGTASGIVGAALSAALLERYAYPLNFALCFALAFAFMLLGWFSMALTREPPLHSAKPPTSLSDYWRRLPIVLRKDSNFGAYVLARILTVLARMGTGFLTVYSAERWHLSDSQAGLYTTVMVLGQAVGNLSLGPLADRRGHKLVLEISLALSALGMLAAVLAPSPVWMNVVFAAVGAMTAADIISMIGIVMEFAEPEDRPTYLGLANTIPGLFAAVAPLIGASIAARTNYRAMFFMATMLSLIAWGTMHSRVVEPRAAHPQHRGQDDGS